MYYNHVCSLCVYLKHLINTLHKEIKLYEQKCIIIFIHHNPKGRETQKKKQLLTKKLKAYSKLKKNNDFFFTSGNSAERDKIDGEQQHVTLSAGESVNL